MNTLIVRADAALNDRLHALAWRRGVSISDVVRGALLAELAADTSATVALVDWIAAGRPLDRRLRRKGRA